MLTGPKSWAASTRYCGEPGGSALCPGGERKPLWEVWASFLPSVNSCPQPALTSHWKWEQVLSLKLSLQQCSSRCLQRDRLRLISSADINRSAVISA